MKSRKKLSSLLLVILFVLTFGFINAPAPASLRDVTQDLAAALITGCKNVSGAEKLGDRHVRALEWGIDLRTESFVPAEIKYIAVRAHHFERAAAPDGDNAFPCRVHRIIDEPFEKIIEFSFETNAEIKSRLHFAISREKAGEYDSGEFTLHVPADKIMCLEG